MLPSIIETVGRSHKVIDLPSKLLQERVIYLGDDITQESTNDVILQLLTLDYQSNDPIDLYIKSDGGSVYDALAVKDVIYCLKSKVNTIGLGCVASAGAYLLASGTGTRKATKSCRIMVHSIGTYMRGKMADLRIEMKESEKLQEMLFNDFKEFTKGKISSDKDYLRDVWLSANEAKDINIIDDIL